MCCCSCNIVTTEDLQEALRVVYPLQIVITTDECLNDWIIPDEENFLDLGLPTNPNPECVSSPCNSEEAKLTQNNIESKIVENFDNVSRVCVKSSLFGTYLRAHPSGVVDTQTFIGDWERWNLVPLAGQKVTPFQCLNKNVVFSSL